MFKNIFWRKENPAPQPLKIDGVGEAPLTADPDDAELAAQVLLEIMATQKSQNAEGVASGKRERSGRGSQPSDIKPKISEVHDASYYKDLAARIRQAHESSRKRTVRFVAFVEQELRNPDLPAKGPNSLGQIEAELYKRIDVIDRYGGELKKRWQHCLAEVTVRLMRATGDTDIE